MCQVGVASGVASEVASASPRNDIPRNDIPHNDIPRNDITSDDYNNKEIMGNPRLSLPTGPYGSVWTGRCVQFFP